MDAMYRNRLRHEEQLNGVTIKRRAHYIPRRQSLLRRLAYESTFTLHIIPILLRTKSDAVLLVIPSLLSAVAAISVARLKRSRVVLWVQDSMHRGAQQTGLAGGITARTLGSLERFVQNRAHSIIIINEVFRSQVRPTKLGEDKVHLVRNWSFLPPADEDATTIRRRFELPSGPLVLHAGNMGLKQGLDDLIECARLALECGRNDICFTLVGGGSQRQRLTELASGLSNVVFLDTVDNQVYANLLSASDFLIVCEAKGVVDMSLPSKLASYFGASRPILAYVDPRSGTAAELVRLGAESSVVDNSEGPSALLHRIVTESREPEMPEILHSAHINRESRRREALDAISNLLVKED